jgi:DNA-binding NarL/FixJ family response regulator
MNARLNGLTQMLDHREVSDPVRILVVDDHDVYRRGLVRMLTEEGLEIIDEARDAAGAIALAARLRPDAIIMDLSLPGKSGIEATREIVAAQSDVRVVILSLLGEEDQVVEALLAGAAGYVLKSDPLEKLIDTVHAAASGEAIIPPRVGERLLNQLRGRPAQRSPRPPAQLTDRERDVLRRMVPGKENAAIAKELGISPNTVKNHAASIYDKLGVDNRLQAVIRAMEHGLLD